MASRCRRYRPRRLQALKDNPELLAIRPSPPSAGLNDLQPFNLSTALMAVHKHCYTSLKLTQQGGPGRRETLVFRVEYSKRGCSLPRHRMHLAKPRSAVTPHWTYRNRATPCLTLDREPLS